MNVKEEIVCRLCLKVTENDFEIIDETTRLIFEGLLLKVNLDISKDPVICKQCAEVVKKCFKFKVACNDKEKLKFALAIEKNKAMFKLKHVYEDQKDMQTVGDKFICRFCYNHLNKSNLVWLDTLMKDVMFAEVLGMLMPDMDFNFIENPIICVSCRQDLESYIKFVQNFLDVEEKIIKYIQFEATPSTAQVKLNAILRFLVINNLRLKYTQIPEIKQEQLSEDVGATYSEINNGKLTKAEKLVDIKYEEFSMDETGCKSSSNNPVDKLNIPCGVESEIGTAQEASTQTSCFINTTVGYRKYRCDTLQNSGIDCDTQSNMISENISEAQNLKCSMCTYETKRKGALKSHMLIHKDITEMDMYKCTMCTYKAKRKFTLKTHMLIHKHTTEVEMHKCSICTYETKQKINLKSHLLTHKDITEVKTYKCSMCTYQAKQRRHLKNHLLIHKDITEMEMYKCSMCPYETKRKGALKTHMLIHKDITEVEMYKCALCTYKAKRKFTLKTHMLIHKDITEVELFRCFLCTFETKQKRNLKNHMLIHKDITGIEMHKCSMCTYETNQKYNLTRHMLIHKDMEIYKCSICTFKTKDPDNIKIHMLIHKDIAEVEMYKCPICSYETKPNACIKKHICKFLNICDNS